MADRADVPAELRERMDAALPVALDERSHAVAARERLEVVLELIADGRGIREAGSGSNAASSELLVADALLTDVAMRAAIDGTLDGVFELLQLERLSERARAIDDAASRDSEAVPT